MCPGKFLGPDWILTTLPPPPLIFAANGGIGYDIAKHWSIQGDIIYTNYADESFHSAGVRVTVNFLAF